MGGRYSSSSSSGGGVLRVRQLETRGLIKLRVIADDGPRKIPPPDDDDDE